MSRLFQLRYRLTGGVCTITAYEGDFVPPNHTRIDIEMSFEGVVIFSRGATYCATPGCLDGSEAKELVTATIAMRPGDTDEDFFDGYTPTQLAWCKKYGEELSLEAMMRYCDQDGKH